MKNDTAHYVKLDQGDSYVLVLPDGTERFTGFTAEGGVDHRDERDARVEELYNEWLDGLRESTRKLYLALLEAGLIDLAKRASTNEWHDYFGKHALNMNHLHAELRIRWATIERDAFTGEEHPGNVSKKIEPIARLIASVTSGDFDATKAEAEEWRDSDEGKAIQAELGPAMSKVIFGGGE